MKMRTYGHFKSALDSVRSAKLRSFWTMLGIIIGVASVITVVSIGQGIKHQIAGQIHRYGKNLITVQPGQLQPSSAKDSLSAIAGLSTSGPLTAKDIKTIAKVRGVAASAPLTITNGTVRGDHGIYRDGLVLGTSSDLPSLLNQSIAYGTFFAENDGETNFAVIGQHASDMIFDENVPLGRSFTFKGEQFIVSGIFNQFTATPLNEQVDFNNVIFIPQAVAERLTNNTAPTYQVLVRPDRTAEIQTVARRIEQSLDKAHGGESNFKVLSANQNLAASNTILDLLTRLIAGVAAISLLVSGIGIMNVMLVSVTERMHEIGIRKAVGATNRQILSQFIMESSVLSFFGGLIGIGLAFIITIILRILTDLQPIISWQLVALASGTSLLVGILFGTVPAIKAARKDPIQALRSE